LNIALGWQKIQQDVVRITDDVWEIFIIFMQPIRLISVFMFRFLYKLTDFGSAREFDENELSTSVYGTEEYLVSSFIYFGFALINLLCI